jgi:hypothetical protein
MEIDVSLNVSNSSEAVTTLFSRAHEPAEPTATVEFDGTRYVVVQRP